MKMLYYERIKVSEGTDVNETSASEEFVIYHYWYFLDNGLKFQLEVCNECHNVLVASMKLSNITILIVLGVD